jgi:hypothetical protein
LVYKGFVGLSTARQFDRTPKGYPARQPIFLKAFPGLGNAEIPHSGIRDMVVPCLNSAVSTAVEPSTCP